jgi:predicted GNAT family N-acyltransferase
MLRFIEMVKKDQTLVEENKKIREICLAAHEYLIDFYEQCGFINQGLSSLHHGPDPWFELRKNIQ